MSAITLLIRQIAPLVTVQWRGLDAGSLATTPPPPAPELLAAIISIPQPTDPGDLAAIFNSA